jgi:CRP/FNR family transcriptional regulator, cyclic AMP receptor protein
MGPSQLKWQSMARPRTQPRVQKATPERREKKQASNRSRTEKSGLLTMSRASVTNPAEINPDFFPVPINVARKFLAVRKKQVIFSQGDRANTVFYIRRGKVRLTVLSKTGKEATIGIVGEGYFLGEGSLAGQVQRMSTASAMTDCELLQMDKNEMMKALFRDPALSELFVTYLLTRNIRYEADLVDQLFNYSEKRLARILLLLAHFGKEGKQETVIPKISQETIAEMIGTSRSRVNFFMNRFKKFGFIHYNGGLQIHSSLLTVFLHD